MLAKLLLMVPWRNQSPSSGPKRKSFVAKPKYKHGETWNQKDGSKTRTNGCPAGAATSWPLSVTHRMLRFLFSTSCQDVKKELNPRKNNHDCMSWMTPPSCRRYFIMGWSSFDNRLLTFSKNKNRLSSQRTLRHEFEEGSEMFGTCLNMFENFWESFAIHMCMQGSHWVWCPRVAKNGEAGKTCNLQVLSLSLPSMCPDRRNTQQ